MNKLQTLTLIIIILASSLLWAVQPQMRRESGPVKPVAVQGEIVEGRSVIVNLASGRVWILEV